MKSQANVPDPHRIAAAVWRQVCLAADACVMAPLLAAMHETGLYGRLADSDGPVSINLLADTVALPRGTMHWAAAMLEIQGLARRCPLDAGSDDPDFTVRLTAAGRKLRPMPDRLPRSAAMIDGLRRLRDGDWSALPSVDMPPAAAAGPGALESVERLGYRGGGPRLAVILHHCAGAGLFDAQPGQVDPQWLAERLKCTPDESGAILELLCSNGWWQRTADKGYDITSAGRILENLLAPLHYAVCYLDTIATIPALLAGKRGPPPEPAGSGGERHLDRALDVAISSAVYLKSCRKPLLDMLLPLFDRRPLDQQPSAIIDCGAGDGSMLIDVFRQISRTTLRGRRLREYPLRLVAVEYNRQAREIAARRLSAAAVPGEAVAGDVTDPAAMAATLRMHGIEPGTALHMNKSVLHNRRYLPPEDDAGYAGWRTNSRRVYHGKDGAYISARAAEWSLVECLRRWRAVCGRHGMIAIEAHGVEYRHTARHIGRQVLTLQEATHALSGQLLLTAAAHRRALRAADFAPLTHIELGTSIPGHPLMTIGHWRPR